MTTSNSTTWQLSRDDIIKASMRKIAALAKGQIPDTEDTSNAVMALNAIVAEMQTLGMPLWKRTSYTFTLVNGTSDYSIGVGQTLNTPFPLKLYQAYTETPAGNARLPIEIISSYNFNRLPVSSLGAPVQLMYTPGINIGTLRLWPTPDSQSRTLTIIYQRPYDDFVNSTDTPDFPKEWHNALIYSLARDLAPEFSLPLPDRQLLAKEADFHTQMAASFGTEEASFFIQPERYWGD